MKTIKVSGGDFNFDSQGKAKWIVDDEKAAQDVANSLLNDLYSISTKAGGVNKNRLYLQSLIYESIDNLKQRQLSQPYVSSREKIEGVSEFTIIPSVSDPTNYYFLITVRTAAGDDVTKVFDKTLTADLSHLFSQTSVPNYTEIPR